VNTRQNNNRDDDARDGDVMPSNMALTEQTLAVDLARVDIDQQIATAHKFPRSIDVFVKKVETMACYNEDAAENCVYSLPRGGKPIIGPSIGFANIVAQAWGNCIDGNRWVATDRREKVVVCEGVFHDLETNRKVVVSEQRKIANKEGRLYNDDMVIMTSKAAGAIARRNAILNAVPRALWWPIWEQALFIVRGDVETFAERKDKALKSFAQFGVTPAQIVAYIGLKGEPDLTLEHIPTLRGTYAALRDATLTVEEILDPRRQAAGDFNRVANPMADDDEVIDRTTGEVQAKNPGQGKPAQPQPAQPQPGDAPQAAGSAAAAATTPGGAAAQPGATGEAATAKPKRDHSKRTHTAAAAAEQTPAIGPVAEPPPETTEPVLPKTAEQYRVHALAWIAAGTSVSALDDQWRAERDMRGTCGVVEDIFDELKKAKDARVAQLKQAV
jgi:hypothetical protein